METIRIEGHTLGGGRHFEAHIALRSTFVSVQNGTANCGAPVPPSYGGLFLIDVQIRQVQCSRELDARFNTVQCPTAFERPPVQLQVS